MLTYHIKRGTVTPRLLTWTPCLSKEDKDCKKSEPVQAFPNQAIATPPRIINISNDDLLIGIARDDFINTELYIREYPVLNQNNKLAKFKPITTVDHDSSIQLLRKNANKGIDVLSFSHRETGNKTNSLPYYPLSRDELIIDQNDDGKIKPKNQQANKIGALNDMIPDKYRLLQIEPIIGDFLKDNCELMLMINRGEPNNEDATAIISNKGKNYKTTVRGYFANLNDFGDCNIKNKPIIFNLDEKSEPFATVPLVDGRAGLLSIRIDDPDVPDNERAKEPLYLELRDLKNCSDKEKCPVIIPESLDASWVRMPVQILTSEENTQSSLLFFSRISCLDKDDKEFILCNDEKLSTNDNYPKTIKLEFEYHRLIVDSNKLPEKKAEILTIGVGSCLIDLDKQRNANKKSSLVEKIKKVKQREACDSKKLPEECKKRDEKYDKEVNPWIFRDFANRWSASQVIPGHIFEQEQGENSDLLDVAVIFKGYPEYSLLLKGQKNNQYQLSIGLSPDYVSCSH